MVGTLLETNSGLTFVSSRETLLDLFRPVIGVIPNSSSLPALLNFHVTASKAGVRVVGTDYTTVVVSTTQDVEVYGEGVVLIPARKIYSVIQQLPENGTLEVSLIDEKLILVGSDGSEWTLTPFDVSSYPKIGLKTKSQQVNRKSLLKALEFVKIAASKDPSNPVLSVVDCSGDKLTAFDGSKLQQIVLDEALPFDKAIANSSLNQFLKVLSGLGDELVSVGANEKYIVVAAHNRVVAVAVPSVTFPKVEQVILRPAIENSYELTTDRAELVQALKKAKITTDVESKAVYVDVSKSLLVIKTRDRMGSSSARTQVQCSWGYEDRTLLLNCDHFIDVLESYDSSRITLRLGRDLKTRKTPVLIKMDGKVSVLQQMMAEWVN